MQPRRHGSLATARTVASRAPSHRRAGWPTVSATRSASRSRRTASTKSPSRARSLALAKNHAKDELPPQQPPLSFDPFVFNRRRRTYHGQRKLQSAAHAFHARRRHIGTFAAIEHKRLQLGDLFPDFVLEKESVIEVDPRERQGARVPCQRAGSHMVTIRGRLHRSRPSWPIATSPRRSREHPILLKDTFNPPAPGVIPDVLRHMLSARPTSARCLCDGIGDAILVRGASPAPAAQRAARVQTSCNRSATASSRPITWRAPVAAARSSTCNQPRPKIRESTTHP